ncbi:MAG: efflux RND transporter periplasmic adaptor subunit [Halioglobus sp.]|nr:efflux RND transporter periplasmic adaptor subunit [Halioglobus sp.]
MQKKSLRRGIPLLVLAVCIAVAFLMVNSRSELPQRDSAVVPPLVDVLTVTPESLAVTILSQGTVRAKHDIELVSEVSGRIIEVAPEFVEGGAVPQGRPLLRIDPIDYEVAVSVAKAGLASAELSLAEVQVVVMRAAIDEAKAQVQASKDRLRQAEVDLQNTVIAAPFDAIIDSKRVDLGQYVQAGTALVRLLSTGSAEIRLPVLPSDVGFLNYGKSADGSWPEALLTAKFGNIDSQWTARLVRLEQRVDEQTRVFYLIAEVDSPYDTSRHPRPLSVGLFVQAEINGKPIPNAVAVPRSALYDGNTVFVVKQGSLQKQQVTVLRRTQDTIIVGHGLSAGDQVVLSRLDIMVEGMPVRVTQ